MYVILANIKLAGPAGISPPVVGLIIPEKGGVALSPTHNFVELAASFGWHLALATVT
jgi:hypothetical protein